jgi:hypothetical protein
VRKECSSTAAAAAAALDRWRSKVYLCPLKAIRSNPLLDLLWLKDLFLPGSSSKEVLFLQATSVQGDEETELLVSFTCMHVKRSPISEYVSGAIDMKFCSSNGDGAGRYG